MTAKTKLELRISEIRTELRTIAETEELTPELRESAGALKTELADCETRLQAAILAEDEKPDAEPGKPLDAETREREELKSRVQLADIFAGAKRGRMSAEIREYQAACKAKEYDIPWDLFEEPETRAVTPAPSSGTGVNVQRIVPAVFAASVAGTLGIDMPRVSSGAHNWLAITTNTGPAGFQAKGDAATATAGALTAIGPTVPHRLSARLEIAAEDVASVGIGTFESALRSNLAMVLSDALDKALINGDGTGNNISGLITTKGAPAAESTTETWTLARGKITNLTDGIWAKSMSDIALMVGVDTIKTFDALFPATTAGVVPRESLSMQLKSLLKSYSSSANMPAAASDVQTAIACKKGRPSEQLAVCARYSEISIADIYTGAARAETSYNLHVLISDVLLIRSDAYNLLSFKLA